MVLAGSTLSAMQHSVGDRVGRLKAERQPTFRSDNPKLTRRDNANLTTPLGLFQGSLPHPRGWGSGRS